MEEIQVKEEVLKMKFAEVYGKFQRKRLTTEEASELLEISVSSFNRK